MNVEKIDSGIYRMLIPFMSVTTKLIHLEA